MWLVTQMAAKEKLFAAKLDDEGKQTQAPGLSSGSFRGEAASGDVWAKPPTSALAD